MYENELVQVLFDAAILVFPVLAGIIAYYLRTYLMSLGEKVSGEIGQAKYDMIVQWAEIMIRAAEQATGLEGDEAKKAYVFEELNTIVDQVGIPISDDQLDALIEGVYNAIKDKVKSTITSYVGPIVSTDEQVDPGIEKIIEEHTLNTIRKVVEDIQ